MPKPTMIAESLLEPLPAHLIGLGMDESSAQSACDVPRISDANGETVIPAAAVAELFETLAAKLDDPAFGLNYAKAYPVGGTGAFGFILTHAKDMRTAVKAIARYIRLVIMGVEVTYEPLDDDSQLKWRYPLTLTPPHLQLNSFLAALVIIRLRAGLSPEWSPKAVQLAHRLPGNIGEYKKIFGPGIAFEQPLNAFTFRNVNLDRPNLAANPRLFKVVQQLGDILLQSRTAESDFRATVANQVVDHLGVAAPTLESVASELGIGARAVQRRLAGEGTTFEAIVSESRKAVAERLLLATDLSLTEIAFMLGFSELSAFTRASNRWFGASPREFRASNRKKAG